MGSDPGIILQASPLAEALAATAALAGRCEVRTHAQPDAGRIVIVADRAGPGPEGQRRRAIRVECAESDVVISPLLDGDGICHDCWTTRRLAAWAATIDLPDDPAGVLAAFHRATDPLRATWSRAQLEAAGCALRRKVDATGEAGGPAQADIIDPQGTLRHELVLPRPDCRRCSRPLPASRVTRLDRARAVESLSGAVAGLVVGLAELPPLPGEPELPYVCYGSPANTWLTVGSTSHRSVSGKAWTANEARIRTFGEAIERYCASFIPADRLVTDVAAALPGRVIRPCAFHGLAEPQADALGLAAEGEAIDWIAVAGPGDARPVWVPADAVYTRARPLAKCLAMPRTTNGLACAPTLATAMARARWELIERDRFFAVWYGLDRARPIPEQVLRDPRAVLSWHQFRGAGISVRLLSCGQDNGVVVIAACGRDLTASPHRPASVLGLGVAPDPTDAAESAMLEMGQVYRGLTHALREPEIRQRARELARRPDLARSPFDHALFHSCANATAMPTFPAEPDGAPMPTAAHDDPGQLERDAWMVNVTTTDISSLLSWEVMRALSPSRIPYHVGIAQIPERKLIPAGGNLGRGIHPLC